MSNKIGTPNGRCMRQKSPNILRSKQANSADSCTSLLIKQSHPDPRICICRGLFTKNLSDNNQEKDMCSLDLQKNVFILRMTGDGEHRFNPKFMGSIISAITYVNQNAHKASAIIVTNDGKYFSNGLDLEWISRQDKETRSRAVGNKFVELLAAIMSIKLPSIAAVCGHACAAGFIFALAHDYRFMRNDRGFLYMSEVDVGMIIPPSVMSVIRSKVDSRHLTEVMLRGLKYGAQEALAKGLVDSSHGSSVETLDAAIKAAVELGKRNWKGEVYLGLRLGAFREAAEKLGIQNFTVLPSRL